MRGGARGKNTEFRFLGSDYTASASSAVTCLLCTNMSLWLCEEWQIFELVIVQLEARDPIEATPLQAVWTWPCSGGNDEDILLMTAVVF